MPRITRQAVSAKVGLESAGRGRVSIPLANHIFRCRSQPLQFQSWRQAWDITFGMCATSPSSGPVVAAATSLSLIHGPRLGLPLAAGDWCAPLLKRVSLRAPCGQATAVVISRVRVRGVVWLRARCGDHFEADMLGFGGHWIFEARGVRVCVYVGSPKGLKRTPHPANFCSCTRCIATLLPLPLRHFPNSSRAPPGPLPSFNPQKLCRRT